MNSGEHMRGVWRGLESRLKKFVHRVALVAAVATSGSPYDYFNCMAGKPKKKRSLIESFKDRFRKV